MNSTTWMQHAWLNRLQTVLLMLFLLGLLAVLGFLLWGEEGVWILLGTGTLMLLLQPALSPWLVLRLYRSRPLQYGEAPVLFDLVKELARRAELPAVPALYLVDSPLLNAFTVGSRHNAVIALSSALLTGMNVRELAGVLAHETAHIRNNDIHVMSLADGLSRMTGMLSLLVDLAVHQSAAVADGKGVDQLVGFAGADVCAAIGNAGAVGTVAGA